MYKELLNLLKTKNEEKEIIIPFKSKFFGEGQEWLWSQKELTRKLLWLEEFRIYLQGRQIYLTIIPVMDSSKEFKYWYYSILGVDCQDGKHKVNRFLFYDEALMSGLMKSCKILING